MLAYSYPLASLADPSKTTSPVPLVTDWSPPSGSK